MQPIKQLSQILEQLASEEHYLFSLSDLRGALPGHSLSAFKTVISRAEKTQLLKRVCRGLYLFPKVNYPQGELLFHAAARLRASQFNYISLETALSDAGVISQIPINWITLMSSGRNNVIHCGDFGAIEFVHTQRQPTTLQDQLTYDVRCHLWRASVDLAIRDMKATRRNMDLVDGEAVDELV